jgi:hypothetical protein
MERDPEYARRKDAPVDDATGARILVRAEELAAAEPTPQTPLDEIEHVIEHAIDAVEGDGDRDAKREKRRQRRKARPHGRR